MIEDKAKDLGRLIGQSAEYQAVKRASDALNEDKDTVALLQQMEKLRVDAQRMIGQGERPSEDMEQQLDTLLGKIQTRGTYQRLLVAQENFDKVMGKVNDWILDGMEKARPARSSRWAEDHAVSIQAALIVFEGPEGVGKTTQLQLLAEALRGSGRDVVAVREPGGTPLGDTIRATLLDPASDIVPPAEALLFMASRAQLVERVVHPALSRGATVLIDRFFLSTYAYQAAGRGLRKDDVAAANRMATGGLVPTLTILLSLPVNEGLRRAALRGPIDRMEQSDRAFHERVARAFDQFATAEWQADHPECGPVVAVEASGTPGVVFERLRRVVDHRFPGLI